MNAKNEKIDNDKVLERIKSKSVDEFFAFINILKIGSKLPEFRKWLREYHKIEYDKDIFEGYKFFLITSLKCFLNSITNDSTLGLEENEDFYRAWYEGVVLEDIPNTCEKVIFIKNVWNLSNEIRKAKNWKELEAGLKNLEKLFTIFNKLYEYTSPTINVDKEEVLKIVTEFYTYIFLNNTQDGYPHGFIRPPIIRSSASEEYFKKVFKGYVYSLQYLWFNLLETEKFEKSCLKNLHKASEIFPDRIKNYAEMISRFNVPEEEKKRLLQLKDWTALDGFFGEIEKEIIRPIEKDLRINLILDALLTLKEVDKSIYRNFLSKDNVKDPEYFSKDDRESTKKLLDYHLLWYKVNVLDTQKLIVFNGVPAFIATLVGLITLNKYHEIDEKVLVRVFKHPVLGIEGYDYSFAILIRAHSSTADHSGWLIFFDCATDYSGLGGSLYEMANAFIKKFKRDGSVEVKEILVDKEIFKEYLAERSSSPIFTDLSISELQKEMENFMGQVKGKLLEYVFYKWINEKYVIIGKVYNKVQCDFWIQGEQIDCIAERDNKIDVFECKISLHDDQIDETIKQIKRKAEIIKNEYKKNVSPHIVVYNAQPEHISKIEKEGINVIQFKDKIENDRLFANNKKEITKILDFRFNKAFTD